MKRLLRAGLWLGCFTMLFFSCNDLKDLEMPESISIKSSDARYSVPIGNYAIKLTDQISAVKLQKQILKNVPSSESEDSSDEAESSAITAFSQKPAVYDYNPNGAAYYQEYIIHYPIGKIDLELGDYLSSFTDLLNGSADESSASDTSDSQNLIPEEVKQLQNKTFKQNINLKQFDAELTSQFNTIDVSNFPRVPVLEKKITTEEAPATINKDLTRIVLKTETFSFETATFASGSFAIALNEVNAPRTYGDDYEATLCAYLCAEGVEEKLASNKLKLSQAAPSGTLLVDLKDKTLYPEMWLEFGYTVTVKTDNPLLVHTYTIESMGFTFPDNEQRLKEITGLKTAEPMSVPIDPITTTDAVSGTDFITSAKIRSGKMEIQGNLPDDWTGVRSTATVALSGAITIEKDQWTTETAKNEFIHKTYAFKDTPIALTEKLTVAPADVQFVFDASDGATITFDKDIELSIALAIAEITDAKVLLAKLKAQTPNLGKDILSPISTKVTNYIKSAEIVEVTINGGIETKNIQFKNLYAKPNLISQVFAIDAGIAAATYTNIATANSDLNIVYCGDADCTSGHERNWNNGVTLDFTQLDTFPKKDGKPAFDFSIGIDLRGENYDPENPNSYDESTDYVIISSLVLENITKCKIEPNLSPHFVCNEVILIGDQFSKSDTIPTGLNIHDTFTGLVNPEGDDATVQDIIDAIYFDGIEGYLYITAPASTDSEKDPFKTFSYNGTIKALYGTTGENSDTILDTDELKIVRTVTDFEAIANDKRVIKKVLFEEGTYSEKTEQNSLCTVINKKPKDLNFAYNITFHGADADGNIHLKRDEMESLQKFSEEGISLDTAISISLAIRLPLRLNIIPKTGDTVDISDIMAFVGQPLTEDLLGREQGEESDYDEYIDLVRSISCQYTFENSTGLNMSADFTATNESGKQYVNEKMYFSGGEHLLEIRREEVKAIFNKDNYPFIPKINVHIAKGTIQIPRNAKLGISAILTAETDGEYEVWSKNSKDKDK